MKVFMLGWEFPPHISGGLGTACYGLTRGLDEVGVDVSFVLPTALPPSATSHVRLRTESDLPPGWVERIDMREEHYKVFKHVTLHQVDAVLVPYATPETYDQAIAQLIEEQKSRPVEVRTTHAVEAGEAKPDINKAVSVTPAGTFQPSGGANYAGDLMGQVNRYARLAVELAEMEEFDIIHAHDWMTYTAGAAVKAATGKPLIVHVHSTEFDRSGDNVNQQIYDVERMGMHVADMVVCVSHLTRNIAISRYGVNPQKVEVLYNAVELPGTVQQEMVKPIAHDEKLVLFLGRLTMQKGPEYFLRAAKKVLEVFPKVRFVVAGSGDMITRCIEEAATLRIGRHVTFTGFLRGADVDRVFSMADLYVMPSVSEPFGIAPLEALSHDVPVIISKQSGVSEVLTHALKVDFWDVEDMANKILAVLRHAPLQKTLRQHGKIELRKFSWTDSAAKLKEFYSQVLGQA
jgi:glycosyltransferase involved in cell wall biosynthesis